MSNSVHLISLLLLASGLSLHAQEKRAMTFDEMVGWERISEQRISDNGKWVFCKMEPWRGDANILLNNDKGEEKDSQGNPVYPENILKLEVVSTNFGSTKAK